jgi:nucleoid-associated protein YgaU
MLRTVATVAVVGAISASGAIAQTTAATLDASFTYQDQQKAIGAELLIESRPPSERAAGFLPASISVPFTLITPENALLPDILAALGARSMLGTYNFSDAMTLAIFDAGPTTMDAAQLNRNIEAQISEAASTVETGVAAGDRFYTVESDDSLAYISRQFHGSTSRYGRIVDANRDKLSKPNQVQNA